MLTALSVRQFAVIEQLEVDFSRGLSVVTGETGAGKSLLVDALLLLSGARADSRFVRTQADRAELSASFATDASPLARAWLEENDLDEDHACELRRVIRADGRSRAWINGRPVTISQLGALAPLLIEIHGQHEHQTLLSRRHQRQLVDAWAQHQHRLDELAAIVHEWRQLGQEQIELQGGDDPAAQLELLRHEIDQLEQWALPPSDLKALIDEHKRAANVDALIQGCQQLSTLLSADAQHSLISLMGDAHGQLQQLTQLDSQLEPILALLDSAQIELGEAASTLDHYAQSLDADPEHFVALDTQLAHIHALSRRHQVDADALHAVKQEWQERLRQLENAGERLHDITARRKALQTSYQTQAQALHLSRVQAAQELGAKVTELMQELGMQGGVFSIDVSADDSGELSASGMDRIEFMVSANKGQAQQPLRKVASGGELARISLALKVATMATDNAATMVFDEVDTGIGGAIAEVVGQKLRALGKTRQVLCVTHLPQVAAQGHQHLQLSKQTDDAATVSRIDTLTADQRVAEIARMLGGIRMTDTTLEHARQMLDSAQSAG